MSISAALPPAFTFCSPSLPLFLRLLLRLSFGPFCDEVSPEVLDDGLLKSAISSALLRLLLYPELDISAAGAFLLFRLGASLGSIASVSAFSSPRERLVRLLSLVAGGESSVAALRLRFEVVAAGGGVSVVLDGEAESGLPAESLAADERVTLWDICK